MVTSVIRVNIAFVFKSKMLIHCRIASITMDNTIITISCIIIAVITSVISAVLNAYLTVLHIVAKKASIPIVICAFVKSCMCIVSDLLFIKFFDKKLI